MKDRIYEAGLIALGKVVQFSGLIEDEWEFVPEREMYQVREVS